MSIQERYQRLKQDSLDEKERIREAQNFKYHLARDLGFDSYMAKRLQSYSEEHIREFAKLKDNDKNKEGV